MNDTGDYISSDDEYSKKSHSPSGSYLNYDGMNGAASSDSESSSSDDDLGTSTCFRSKPLNPEEIKNHLKGNLSFGLPSKDRNDGLPFKNDKGAPVGQILLHHLTQPGLDYIAKEIDALPLLKDKNDDIKRGYRLVRELMAASLHHINSPFMADIKNSKNSAEFLDIIKKPLWLPKIRESVIHGEYKEISEVVRDLRVMLQNAYTFYGPKHSNTKKALHLEFEMEQKLSVLPEEMKEMCTLEKTNGVTLDESEMMLTKSSRICVKDEIYVSRLLYSVRGCKMARDKELKMKKIENIRRAKQEKEMEFVKWEERVFQETFGSQINALWELAQIGQFLVISLSSLNIYDISQYEVERMLLVPEYSSALRMLMTSLVSSPFQRQKIAEKPYMPYKIWANKLAAKVNNWYKIYKREKCNAAKVSERLGIDPQFWSVCGSEWPFKYALFHELEFYKRVWLLKALCDFVAHNHKSVQECIMEQPEDNLRERILGKDREQNQYIYLPQFINYNIRIYRRTPFFTEEEETVEKDTTNVQTDVGQCSETVFSKEQLKYYKTVLRNSKRKIQNEDVWEYRAAKKPKRSSTSRPKLPSAAPEPATPRSRPGNLRQRPTRRVLNEPVPQYVEESSEDEAEPPRAARWSAAKDLDNSVLIPSPSKCPPLKKSRKKSYPCTDCGKEFSFVGALNGHMAIHSRKKKRSPRQSPENETSNLSEEDAPKEGSLEQQDTPAAPSEQQEEGAGKTSTAEDNTEPRQDLSAEAIPSDTIPIKKEMVTKEEDLWKEEDKDSKDGCMYGVDCKQEVADSKDSIKKEDRSNDFQFDLKRKIDSYAEGKFHQDEDSTGNKDTNVGTSPGNGKDLATNGDLPPKPNSEQFPTTESVPTSPSEPKDPTSTNGDNDSTTDGKGLESLSGNGEPKETAEPIKDIVWDFCDPKSFQLVVCNVQDLRTLIKKFGPVPAKVRRNEEDSQAINEDLPAISDEEDGEDDPVQEDNNKTDTDLVKDLPDCEKSLYQQLCDLLADFLPYESKLKSLQGQVLRKMYKEGHIYKNRHENYVDPDEEAWKSDPEPEPEPIPETPTVSSSSSSSEDEFYEDGARKRKLRKRKCRQQGASLSASCEQTPVPSPVYEAEQETTTVSSRGRVRKVKKIVNYDKLDFEKLAEDAEKERKRKRRDFDDGPRTSHADFFKIPSTGVQRYLMSKTGDVTGYIDTNGQTHYCNPQDRKVLPKEPVITPTPTVTPVRSIDLTKLPTLAVAATTRDGKEVMVRVTGAHAQNFLAKVEKEGRSSNRAISVTHNCNEYTFPLNSTFYTRNIPGYPDCVIPHTPPKKVPNSTTAPARPSVRPPPSILRPMTGVASVNGSIRQPQPNAVSPNTPTNACKRIMLKTARGPVHLNLSPSLASLLDQGQTSSKVSAVPNASVAYATAGPSSNVQTPKIANSIKIYKSPLPSVNNTGTASTSSGSQFIIMNQSTTQVQQSVQSTQQLNNYIQINNANNGQIIQIQQAPNLIQYSQPSNQSIVQVVPQATAATTQPTYVPVPSTSITQQNAFIQRTPVYNQVIVQPQSPMQIPSTSVIIPRSVQQLAPQPVQQLATQPVQQLTPQPIQQLAHQPVQQLATQPVQQLAPQPVQQLATQPVQQLTTQSVQNVTPGASVSQPQAAATSGGKGPSKIFLIQTNEGQKVCLQTTEGKLVILTNEQIQVLIKRGAIKSNPT